MIERLENVVRSLLTRWLNDKSVDNTFLEGLLSQLDGEMTEVPECDNCVGDLEERIESLQGQINENLTQFDGAMGTIDSHIIENKERIEKLENVVKVINDLELITRDKVKKLEEQQEEVKEHYDYCQIIENLKQEIADLKALFDKHEHKSKPNNIWSELEKMEQVSDAQHEAVMKQQSLLDLITDTLNIKVHERFERLEQEIADKPCCQHDARLINNESMITVLHEEYHKLENVVRELINQVIYYRDKLRCAKVGTEPLWYEDETLEGLADALRNGQKEPQPDPHVIEHKAVLTFKNIAEKNGYIKKSDVAADLKVLLDWMLTNGYLSIDPEYLHIKEVYEKYKTR